MAIAPDGVRSSQRIGFTRHLMEQLRMLGVPSKAVVSDGFLHRVLKLGDIETGIVMAPVGAIVACSTASGVQVSAADYWLGAFAPSQPLYVPKYLAPDYDAHYFSQGTAVAVPTQLFAPVGTTNPTPVIRELSGEYCTIHLSSSQVVDGQNQVFSGLHGSLYNAAGISEYAAGVRMEAAWGTAYTAYSQPIPCSYAVQVTTALVGRQMYEDPDGGEAVLGAILSLEPGTEFIAALRLRYPLAALSVPIQDLFCKADPVVGSVKPVSSFGWSLTTDASPTIAHLITTTDITYPPAHPEYYDPQNDVLLMIYNYQTGGVLLQKSFLIAFLASVGITESDPVLIASKVAKFFGYPCTRHGGVEADSAWILASSDTAYVWTRTYGAVKYSTTTGLTRVTSGFTLPAEVGTAGVRPNIVNAGSGLYLCACESTATPVKIVALYYGSPFSGWSALPMPAGDLMAIRGVFVEAGSMLLLGVVRISGDTPDVDTYYFACLRYTGAESWIQLGQLPFSVSDPDAARWAVGLYGDGAIAEPLVRKLRDFLQPPSAVYGAF